MNRKLTLTLTLAVALASQLALGGCNKKEDVVPSVDTTASAPYAASGGMMAASAAPMDSISSASAVAGAEAAASAAAQAASDAAMAASR